MALRKAIKVVAPLGQRSMCSVPPALSSLSSHKFCWNKLGESVSADTFSKFKSSVVDGSSLDKAAANEIAKAMQKWAMSLGAVNYAHWFSPVRGEPIQALNGLKFDAFVDLDFSDPAVVKPMKVSFSGGQLFMNETDGSSFPNGGLRATHTAAAYDSWDKISPPFVYGDTLYIPSAFIAWTGAALDHKTPLLRSQDAINKEGMRLLKHLGDTDAQKVVANVGWEQEYFIIDADMYTARPDLVASGRMLFGALSDRNQEGCENYFGIPNARAKAFMADVQA